MRIIEHGTRGRGFFFEGCGSMLDMGEFRKGKKKIGGRK